jgi:hypothetical protein
MENYYSFFTSKCRTSFILAAIKIIQNFIDIGSAVLARKRKGQIYFPMYNISMDLMDPFLGSTCRIYSLFSPFKHVQSTAYQTVHFGLCNALISRALALISNCNCVARRAGHRSPIIFHMVLWYVNKYINRY